jgi:hypothetical protein
LSAVPPDRRRRRAVPWRLFSLLGLAALAWWFYAAPANLANRLRSAVEQPGAGVPATVADRVDFAAVNAQLASDLRRAVPAGLDGAGFAHLLLYGWLPQQRANAAPAEPLAPGMSVRSRQTRVYIVRYKALNRAIATFWDPYQIHQVILTLERQSVVQRWRVTRVAQFNTCAYDFDCKSKPLAPARADKDKEGAEIS